MRRRHLGWLAAGLLFVPQGAQAATLNGAAMGWPWALPFAAMLASIAMGPVLFPAPWHRHYGKIAVGWSALALAALALAFGIPGALAAFVHAILADYLSFIVVLFALYVTAGGILVTGNLPGTPLVNTTILLTGTLIASLIGTTGAAMVLIRPLLTANAGRAHRVHVVVFFIILVANIGGALSPLGDPPLFVGFLRGVDFFWPGRHLWLQTVIVAVPILVMFLLLDTWLYRAEPAAQAGPRAPARLRVQGGINFALIALIIGAILASAVWKPDVSLNVYGTEMALQNVARDVALVLIALASLWLTPTEHRAANGFTWEPIREVAKLFAGIFVTIIPVLAMLQAGRSGAFAWLLRIVTEPDGSPQEVAYFWLTGGLSAFLDNAPTYLVFFELAGGDPVRLMGPLAGTLVAISLGAVYMGALTYIGNAPNFMVKAIAEERGIKMPSFFAYMLWAVLILVPLFALLTWLPVAPMLKPF